ncbi:MAG: hypothetical protein ABI689_09860 [Thermoanaerobaculia bacterium]
MRHLLLIPIVLSALTLGAHLLRGGHPLVALVAVALPFLLVPRSVAALRLLQGLLLLGACEWLRTLAELHELRRALGQPWQRMAVILGAVALVTALSALVAGRWSRGRGAARSGREAILPSAAA